MPWTFSHPLVVVPLRRLCPERLNFTALIIGSMSPDFGYYIGKFPVANFAHTGLGTLVVCLPMGLLALGLFYLIRRPLCFVLPQPHRAALMPLASRRPSVSVPQRRCRRAFHLAGRMDAYRVGLVHPSGRLGSHASRHPACHSNSRWHYFACSFQLPPAGQHIRRRSVTHCSVFPLAATPADDRDRRHFSPRPLALLTHRSPRSRRSRYRRPRSLSPGLTLRGVFGVSGFPLPHCRLLCCSVRPTADRLFLRFLYRRPTKRLTNAP
jgi:hypothetical protein